MTSRLLASTAAVLMAMTPLGAQWPVHPNRGMPL